MPTVKEILKVAEFQNRMLNVIENQELYTYSDMCVVVSSILMGAINYGKENK